MKRVSEQIQEAVRAGIKPSDISKVSGIARSTIYRLIEGQSQPIEATAIAVVSAIEQLKKSSRRKRKAA